MDKKEYVTRNVVLYCDQDEVVSDLMVEYDMNRSQALRVIISQWAKIYKKNTAPSVSLVFIPGVKVRDDLIEFFGARIQESENGCWEWSGSFSGSGYGEVNVGIDDNGERVKTYAHRLSWMIYYGEIPSGMFVCHRCDNPKCVHPSHLFLGTVQDNNDDRIIKSKGSLCINRGITESIEATAIAYRAMGNRRSSEAEAALLNIPSRTSITLNASGFDNKNKKFGINRIQVAKILLEKNWDAE